MILCSSVIYYTTGHYAKVHYTTLRYATPHCATIDDTNMTSNILYYINTPLERHLAHTRGIVVLDDYLARLVV